MEVRYPPLKSGISAILARYPMKTRQVGAIPPSAILSRKDVARFGGYLTWGHESKSSPHHNSMCLSRSTPLYQSSTFVSVRVVSFDVPPPPLLPCVSISSAPFPPHQFRLAWPSILSTLQLSCTLSLLCR